MQFDDNPFSFLSRAAARIALLGLTGVVLVLGAEHAPSDAPARQDRTPRVGILSAFASEASTLVSALNGPVRSVDINGVRFTSGRLFETPVVIALTNYSIVNAAMTTQLLLDRFHIDRILFSGVAGGVSPEAPLGSVTIPERWGFHQEMYFHREGSSTPCTSFIGIQLAEQIHPGEAQTCAGVTAPAENLFGPFGFVFLRKTNVSSERYAQFLTDGSARALTPPGQAFNPATDQDLKFWFDVDADMLEVGREVAREASSGQLKLLDCRPEDLRTDGSCASATLQPAPRVIVGQNGVSGPTFVDNADYRRWVYDKLVFDDGPGDGTSPDRVLALDMETAAAHMVAYANDTPFLAVRSVSDLAGEQPDPAQFGVFVSVAAENSSRVVLRLLELLENGRHGRSKHRH